MAGIASESSSSSSSSEDLVASSLGDRDQSQEHTEIEGLLQRRRCELMYELKHLQHGERPVTGTQSRQQVNQFFTKRVRQAENPTPVSNVDDVDEHRPQQITVEVQGLIQSRSVSSILQSQSFRRSLEAVVGRHVSSRLDDGNQQRSTPENGSSGPRPDSSANNSVSVTSNREQSAADTHNVAPVSRMYEMRRDELVMEISELVHRQMVSQTLHGNFRGTLENTVREHVEVSGTDPSRPIEAISNLPPSNIRRNDFSHFGILPPQAQANSDVDDAMSLVSATAMATIPFAQSNAAVNREIGSLKTQIAELTHMLRASMELQVDIQRSIKQEVAAAISQAPAASTQTHIMSRRADDSKCLVCLENGADAVFYRCGHLCSCYTCAMRLKSKNTSCPVCRAPIVDIMRTYRISHE